MIERVARMLIPRWYRYQWHDVLSRLSSVEVAIDTLIRYPKYQPEQNRAFNRQEVCKEIFRQLLVAYRFEAIVETGTYLGETTGFLAETSGVPVYTVEYCQRFKALAEMRLAGIQNIKCESGDSRVFLRCMAQNMEITRRRTFFYLDAHWNDDLPLAEEIELIAGNWAEFVILIDDFRVPDDDGYGYDCYGKGIRLELNLIQRQIASNALVAFFPSTPSSEETGAKRGCVVLTRQGDLAGTMEQLALLRQAPCRG